MKKKVALFGGAFNPPTLGHQEVVKQVLEANVIDEVWVTPAYVSMTGKDMVGFDERVEMCNLTFGNIPNVVVSDFEKEYNNYGSVELIKKLLEVHPDIDFHFIIGLDNAKCVLTTWKRGSELIELVKIIVLNRQGEDHDGQDWFKNEPHIFLDGITVREISSTDIRDIYKNMEHNHLHGHIFLLKNLENKTFKYINKMGYYAPFKNMISSVLLG